MRARRSQRPLWLLLGLLVFTGAAAPGTTAAQPPVCADTSLYGPVATPLAGWNQRRAAVADFNEDGLPDLAITSIYLGLVVVLGEEPPTAGEVAFGPRTSYGGPGALGIVVADLNADGILDVATAIENSGIALFRGGGQNGVGDGTFELYRSIDLAGQSWDLAVGDVNADGALDLVVGGYNSRFSVLRGLKTSGAPNGEFSSPVTILSDAHFKGLKLADLNGDGALDVVAATETSWIVIHRGLLGSGGPNGDFGPAIKINGQASSTTYDVLVADFNQDAKLDVASANYATESVSVFLGDGALGFPTIRHHPVAGSPLGLAMGDVNRDGRSDLLAAAAGEAAFSWLPQRGATGQFPDGFRSALVVGTQRTGFGVAAADLNGDLAIDVVLPNYDQEQAVIYPNRCFDATLEVGATPPALTLQDVRPNPVIDGRLTVHYTLAGSGPALLELIDVGGRRRHSQDLAPGESGGTVRWELGRRVPAGAYWLRLTQSGKTRVTPVLVLH